MRLDFLGYGWGKSLGLLVFPDENKCALALPIGYPFPCWRFVTGQ